MSQVRFKWLVVGAFIALLIGGCGRAATGAGEAAPPAVSAEQNQALHGLGKLAFVREGRLHILDGYTDTLRSVARAEPALSPQWSADGQWISFRQGEAFRIANPATGEILESPALPADVAGFAWAPSGSALAVIVATGGMGGYELRLLQNPGKPDYTVLARRDAPFGGLTWSPDGQQTAYVATLPFTDVTARDDVLEVVPAAGGEPVRWYTAVNAGIQPAGWSPDGQRLLFWLRPGHCLSCAADGLPLQSLARGAREPVALPVTLMPTAWLSWRPGTGELLMVRGGGRPVWDEKSLTLCDAKTGKCRDLPQPERSVSLDPAWSPDGERMAFVRAERRPGEWGFPSPDAVKPWVESRTLWIANAGGSEMRPLTAAGTGVYSPAWASDGRHLLYVKDDAVWVMDLEQGESRKVAALEPSADLFGFYGHRSFSHLLAWFSR